MLCSEVLHSMASAAHPPWRRAGRAMISAGTGASIGTIFPTGTPLLVRTNECPSLTARSTRPDSLRSWRCDRRSIEGSMMLTPLIVALVLRSARRVSAPHVTLSLVEGVQHANAHRPEMLHVAGDDREVVDQSSPGDERILRRPRIWHVKQRRTLRHLRPYRQEPLS